MRIAIVTLLLVGVACGSSNPRDAPVTPAGPTPSVPPTPVAPPATTCGPQPEAPITPTPPTCADVTLKSGQSWHDQLTVQLSSGASTRLDCPRMRFQGQDTPVCVTKSVGGRIRGACCPPGHSDPLDPACVNEGSVDEMFKRQKVWEWCDKDRAPSRPCEPCVWVTGAQRN